LDNDIRRREDEVEDTFLILIFKCQLHKKKSQRLFFFFRTLKKLLFSKFISVVEIVNLKSLLFFRSFSVWKKTFILIVKKVFFF
jgi:hypothetical protein